MKNKSYRRKAAKLDLSTLPPPPPHPPPHPIPTSPKPDDVPGLFVFEWCDLRGGWFASCDEPLRTHYYRIANRDSDAIDLAQALAMIGSHKLKDLRILQQGVCKIKEADKSVLVVESKKKWCYWFMLRHCVELACALHEAFGNDLSSIFHTYLQPDPTPTLKSDRDRMEKKFAKILLYAFPGSGLPLGRGRPPAMVVVKEDGMKRKIPLPLRAIQVALDLATTLRRSPTKLELTRKLEELHPETEQSQRTNVSAINWSTIWKQAGLSKLPNSRSGNAKQPFRSR